MQQQNPDGSWSEAVTLGWQGSGIDWEITTVYEGETGWRFDKPVCYIAEGYDEDILVAKITAKWRWLVRWRIHRWHRKHPGSPPNRG